MGYFAYYPMIGIVTIYYFLFRFEWFEKVSFVLVTSFFIYYLIYILVPVAGPQFYFPAIGMDNVMAQHFLLLVIISIIMIFCCPVPVLIMVSSLIW